MIWTFDKFIPYCDHAVPYRSITWKRQPWVPLRGVSLFEGTTLEQHGCPKRLNITAVVPKRGRTLSYSDSILRARHAPSGGVPT